MDLDFEVKRVPRGEIAANYLPTLLFAFLDQRLTGRVTFTQNAQKIDLIFDRGSVRGARSNDMAHRLGEILLMRGKIKVAQYEQSVLRMLEDGIRQGDALVEMGSIDQDTLRWGIARQSKEIIYTLFHWSRMEYRVKSLSTTGLDENTQRMSTHELVLRGLQRIDDWPRIRNELFPYKQVFAINQSIRMNEAKKIRIKSDEEQVLSLVDGTRTIAEILALSPLSGYETARLLYAFKWARITRLELSDT